MNKNEYIMDAARQLDTAACCLRLIYWAEESEYLTQNHDQFINEALVNISAALTHIQSIKVLSKTGSKE